MWMIHFGTPRSWVMIRNWLIIIRSFNILELETPDWNCMASWFGYSLGKCIMYLITFSKLKVNLTLELQWGRETNVNLGWIYQKIFNTRNSLEIYTHFSSTHFQGIRSGSGWSGSIVWEPWSWIPKKLNFQQICYVFLYLLRNFFIFP